MASILMYTSPARGHLYPILGVALELRARGHQVHVRTLAREVDRVLALGLGAAPIAPAIEAREMDDWRGKNSLQALEFAMATFGDRAVLEVDDVQAALAATQAEALLVDTNSWGAQAVAEASGLPWATFQPYFTPLPAPGVPPFGPGLARSTHLAGRMRDAIMGKIAIPTDKAVLLKDVADRVKHEDEGKDAHDAIHYQGDYVKELIAETDYPSFDVDGACEAFFEWKEHKKYDIMAFRNNAYKSVITGTMAPVHHTP